MKKLIYLLLIAISWPSFAARQFDIEVILFKRNIDPAQISEAWPDQQPPVNMQGTVSFADESLLASKEISLMLPEQYQLTPQYDKLKGHAGFTPLAHFGWRQGDLSKAAAPKFHLTAGRDYSAQFLADGTSKTAVSYEAPTSPQPELATSDSETLVTTDGIPTITDVPAVAPEPPLYELEGSIRVYVQHFLFTEANLDLREPGRREVIVGAEPLAADTAMLPEDSNVQVGHLQEVKKKVEVEEFLKSYRFEQQRKMRSGETHYLDHPLMGMVIQIRRVEEE